jgi:malonyl CoA-acyl carrier protein transacylase
MVLKNLLMNQSINIDIKKDYPKKSKESHEDYLDRIDTEIAEDYSTLSIQDRKKILSRVKSIYSN